MTKFKVGDKVRLIEKPTIKDINTCYVKSMDILKVGDIGEVIRVDLPTILVKFDNLEQLWYSQNMLELVDNKSYLSTDAWGDCYDWSKAEKGITLEKKFVYGYGLHILIDVCGDRINSKSIADNREISNHETILYRPHFYADRKRMWKEKEKEYTLQELVGKKIKWNHDSESPISIIKYADIIGAYAIFDGRCFALSINDLKEHYNFADGSPIRIKHD